MHSFVPVEWKGEEYALGTRANFFSARLLPLWRCSYRFFAAQRAHRKKFMPARFTAHRRKTQQSSEESHHPRHVLRRNALQFEIAADPAMRVNNVTQRGRPRAKSSFAIFAAPGQNARRTQQIVPHRPAPGAPYSRSMTTWADQSGCGDRSISRKRICKNAVFGKRQPGLRRVTITPRSIHARLHR